MTRDEFREMVAGLAEDVGDGETLVELETEGRDEIDRIRAHDPKLAGMLDTLRMQLLEVGRYVVGRSEKGAA